MKIEDILKEVVISNNLNWLHTRERAEYQYNEGKIPLTTKDLLDTIEKLPIHINEGIENTEVKITKSGIIISKL